jgi:hypothetical protein
MSSNSEKKTRSIGIQCDLDKEDSIYYDSRCSTPIMSSNSEKKTQSIDTQCDLDSEQDFFYYHSRCSTPKPQEENGGGGGGGGEGGEGGGGGGGGERRTKEEDKTAQEEEESSCKKFATVDMHWFKGTSNQIIVKEIGIVDQLNSFVVLHFKSPFAKSELNAKLRKQVTWAENNYHKIRWEDGNFIYTDELLISYLEGYDKIYTKGTEKAKFLRRLHKNVCCLPDEIEKPNFNYFTSSWCYNACEIHHRNPQGRCALFAAVHYNTLIMKNMDSSPNFMCENNRMLSMKKCQFYSNTEKKNFARYGFFYNGREIQCVYCKQALKYHTARVCCIGGKAQEPFNFSILVPTYV